MRRRLALLVAATTSVVLVAFLVPLAVLVSRSAASAAVNDATAHTQVVVSSLVSGADDTEVAGLLASLRADGLDVRVVRAGRAPRSAGLTRTAAGAGVLSQPVVVAGRTVAVVTVIPRDRLTAGVRRAWLVLFGLGLLLVGLSLVVADRLARAITAPIAELAVMTRRLAAGDLEARVEPTGPAEVRDVGLAVNRLAARIQELLAHERESVADLSHRLRTPVTALRLDVEALPAGAERDRVSADVDDLDRQVDGLIRQARRPARAGLTAGCDATAVVRERVEFWQALAEDQGRPVGLSLPAAPCPVRARLEDLEAALDALLGNVLAHTPDGASLDVTLTPAPGGGAVLVVSDQGPGFPAVDVVARGRSGGGSTGLGLDIVRRTAEESGGSLAVANQLRGGAQVTVLLGPPRPA